MSTILFATTNQRKLKEAQEGCQPYGLTIQASPLHIDEIQSDDPVKIATHKATQAFIKLGSAVVVTDTFWDIPSLNGFPGGYMKEVAEWLTAQDFLHLLQSKSDRRLRFIETIAFFDGRTKQVFSQDYWGEIATTPAGQGNAIEQIATFNGRTLAQALNANQTSHQPQDYVWDQFGRWYTEYLRQPDQRDS